MTLKIKKRTTDTDKVYLLLSGGNPATNMSDRFQ